jgi:hypothetical protein
MDSLDLKTACLCYLRFARRMPYIATEFSVGWNYADVFAADKDMSLEIEVKVSVRDFCRDFFKHKHEVPDAKRSPNKFYFAIPVHIKDAVEAQMKDKNVLYGLMTYDDQAIGPRLWEGLLITKRAGWLHREPPKPELLERILLRMGSEIAGYSMASIASREVNKIVRDRIDIFMNASVDKDRANLQAPNGEVL